jgi:RND family efflux transporter MFP subunit
MATQMNHRQHAHTVFIALAGALVFAQRAEAQGPGFPPPAIVASPVIEREITASQTFVGTVMPLKKAIVGSAVDGRVIEFPLNEGDRVEQGQPLAQLLTDTIKLEIETADAELRLRQEQLAELENGTRPEEVEQAKARMLSAEARMKYAAARRARGENLFREGRAMSEEERDEMISLAVEAQQSYFEAKAAYQLAVKGPRKEQIAQARAQVAMSQATVNRLKDQLAKHTVIARFSGYVTAEHTEVGSWVQQGDPVAEIDALDEVEVTAQVVEQYAPYLRTGMQVSVEVPALAGRTFTGVVSAIVPQADVQARTFPVKVRVKNELGDGGPLIKSGMYARVMLPTGRKELAKLVSKDALVLGGPQPAVVVVDLAGPNAQQGKVRSVPVELGIADGNWIHVTGQLTPGQLVVVQGNERLRPAQEVQVQSVVQPPAAANQTAPAKPASEARLR